jgi:hypothetical protein
VIEKQRNWIMAKRGPEQVLCPSLLFADRQKEGPVPTLRLLPDLEDALRQLPGVQAASVVTGPDATPTEVHVLATPGKAAKQVVRDVQSLALARYDLDIDHRIVSVVQIGEDDVLRADDAALAPPASARPKLAAIMVRTSGAEGEASVTITAGNQVFEGTAAGPAGASHRPRLVAMATLDAVGELLGHVCEVESASIVNVGQREVAVCVLTLMVPRSGEQVLTGSAAVRGDDADAMCKAVLDALNRQLSG